MQRSRTSLLLLVLLSLGNGTFAQLPRLWGMTTSGGANNKGTLFHVDADGTDFSVAYHFSDSSGYAPEGTLCLANNGKLYGTTNLGGSGLPGAGTLFSFDMATSTFNKLVDFNISNGGYGWGGMVAHPDGKLYGATYGGGGSGGSIFRVDPATDTYSILYALNQSTDGGSITNRLAIGNDGLLYGCAAYGGTNGGGTLFRFDPSNSAFTKLHDLDGALNGNTPYGSLCDAGNGWFYGATYEGGTDDEGVLFKYAPGNNTFVKLLDFTGPNGQSPWNGPIFWAADQLIGTTALGGSNGSGVIYGVDPATDTFSELYSFNVLDGGLLFGNVMAVGGALYGNGGTGGTNFEGTVYRYDPMADLLTTLHSFSGATDGSTPRGDLVAAGTATGVNELQAIPAFALSPNPTNGHFTITLTNDRAATLRVLNSVGQVVHQARLLQQATTLDLGLAPGLYLLETEVDGVRVARRLVVE